MLLTRICPSCTETIKIRSSAITRPELEKEMGEEFWVNCPNCSTDHKTQAKDVAAHPSWQTAALAAGGSLLITAYCWQFLGAVSTLSFTIPIMVYQQQVKNASLFNKTKTRWR